MTVHDLSKNEIEELRETYFIQLQETDPEVLEDIDRAELIPINAVKEHYEGITFVKDDFFCNI